MGKKNAVLYVILGIDFTNLIPSLFKLMQQVIITKLFIDLFRCVQDFVSEKERRRKDSERYKECGTANEDWEKFIQQKQLQVWRRPQHTSGLYEYKGTVLLRNTLYI